MRLQSETIIPLILLIAGALATIIIYNVISPNLNIINPSGQEISRSLELNFQLLDYFIANNTLYAYVKPSEPVNYSQVFAIVNDRLVNVYPYNSNGSIVNPYNNGLLIVVANLSQIPLDQNGNYKLEVGLENDIIGIFTIKYISNTLINYFQPPIIFNISNSTSSIPTCPSSYLPLILYNNQNISTPSPFQQDIAICNGSINIGNSFAYINNATIFNQINSNGSNIYFTTTCNNAPNIYSWYEGQFTYNGIACDVWWINISQGIPANSNVTIYMNIGPNSDNYYSQYYPYVGEAPYLSSTYGQYDNGNYVFLFYDNFVGTSLNTSKWTSGVNGGSYTVNNELTITLPYNASSGSYVYISTSSYTINFAQIVESYANLNGFVTSNFRIVPIALTQYNNVPWEADLGKNENAVGWVGDVQAINTVSAETTTVGNVNVFQSSQITSTSEYQLWGIVYPNNGSITVQYNYQNWGSTTTYVPPTPLYITISNYIYPAQNVYTTTYPINVYWVRARAYPPNGIMPSNSQPQKTIVLVV